MRRPGYLPSPSTPFSGTVRAFGRRSGLLRPLLTSVPRSGRLAAPSVRPVSRTDTTQISWGKPHSLPRAPAGFTALALDGYGLRDILPARPTNRCLISGCCSSGRDFAPRFLQTVPRGSALALHSCFTSIRLHRGLSPPGCWTCPAHRTLRAAFGGGLRPSLGSGPIACLDCGCARRPAIVRPGRRNGAQPNQETWLVVRRTKGELGRKRQLTRLARRRSAAAATHTKQRGPRNHKILPGADTELTEPLGHDLNATQRPSPASRDSVRNGAPGSWRDPAGGRPARVRP